MKGFLAIACVVLTVQSEAQSFLEREDMFKTQFGVLDSFLLHFFQVMQFRQPAGDSLSLEVAGRYSRFFNQGCAHPDLINPVSTGRGEPILPSKVSYKPVEQFVESVKKNYPKGLFVRVRALNADFRKFNKGEVRVVMERKTWGDVKGRWKLEVVDTVQLDIQGIANGSPSISALQVVGFGYVLTDVKKISDRIIRASRAPDLKEVRRAWEAQNIPRKKRSLSELQRIPSEIPDSVAKNSPCTFADRVFSVSELSGVLFTVPDDLTSYYRKQPLVVYSDRYSNMTYDAPSGQAEYYMDLKFLQPCMVIDTSQGYLHLVEYVEGGVDIETGEIRKCLDDYGWIRSSRVIIGPVCMIDPKSGMPVKLVGNPARGQTESERTKYRRFFESPELSNERVKAPRETTILYVYKQAGGSVLVGTKDTVHPTLVDKTIIGWVNLKDLLIGLEN